MERVPDTHIGIGAHVVHAVLRIIHPQAQFQIYAVVAETHEACRRGWIGEHARGFARRLLQQRHGGFGVVLIADLYR